jgi:hypothetical protein
VIFDKIYCSFLEFENLKYELLSNDMFNFYDCWLTCLICLKKVRIIIGQKIMNLLDKNVTKLKGFDYILQKWKLCLIKEK